MSEEAAIPSWAQALPPELHDIPYLKGSDTPAAFREQVQHAAAHQGNSLRMPGPDAAPEELREFQTWRKYPT
jgi:hypothetical protein